MAKWYGKVGYGIDSEVEPGIHIEDITEVSYYGEIYKNTYRSMLQNPVSVNDNISLNMYISILADPFAMNNFCNIKYVKFSDTCWKVNNVEIEYPRLKLTIGGVYNGEQA